MQCRRKQIRLSVISAIAALALAGCTTGEKVASGTVAGGVAGAAISGNAGGAVVGALIGGFGTFLAVTANGNCQYRNSRGQVYTTRCHWL